MKKAIYLDRDGVINAIHYDEDIGLCTPHTPGEFVFLQNVSKSVKTINSSGFLAVVVCNQPDVSKGRLAMNVHEKINEKMISGLIEKGAKLDGIYYCFHKSSDGCECRKPKPGMLLQAAKDLDIELKNSYIVGDTLSDIEAGKAAGCKTILVANPRLDLIKIIKERGCDPDYIAKDLEDAINIILSLEMQGVI